MSDVTVTFICRFCLEPTELPYESGMDFPTECGNCRVGYCGECSCALKLGSTWCFSCGEVEPDVESSFCRATDFASCYQERGWAERQAHIAQTDPGDRDPDELWVMVLHKSGNRLLRNEKTGETVMVEGGDE